MVRSFLPVSLASFVVLAFITPAHAANGFIDCYEDLDHDGYAASTSTVVDTVWATTVSIGFPATHAVDACPSGSAPRAGDCDDLDYMAHPFSAEWSDGTDNDCDGLVDEPTFSWKLYDPTIHRDTSVKIEYAINDEQTLAYLDSGALVRAAIDYRAVTGEHSVSIKKMVHADSTHRADVFTLHGLLPGTVYEIDVVALEFYAPNFGIWFDIYDVEGNPLESDTFYTMTTGGLAGDDRAEVVLETLYHYGVYDGYGLAGYAGWYRDGTAYGAEATEAWCSEFYDSMVEDVYGDPSADNIFDLEDWFRDTPGAYYWSTEDGASEDPTAKIRTTYPGEWFWWDQGGASWSLKKSNGHTAMVLGYDPVDDRVTYVSGNAGNRIAMGSMLATDSRIAGGGVGWLP